MKKVLSVLICTLLVFSLGSVGMASDNTVTIDYSDYDASSPIGRDLSKKSGTITTWSAGVSINSSTSVTVSATTVANNRCDKIGAYFTLQKWNGSSWETYKTGSSYATNSSLYEATYSFTVGSGTYRLVANHRVYNGSSIYDSKTSTTSSFTP